MAVLIGIILILLCLVVGIIYHDTHSFVVQAYEIASDKIADPVTCVLVSDLHGTSFGEKNEKLLTAVRQVAPDFILVAGDMLTAAPGEDFTTAVDTTRGLCDIAPVYYGSGNHEYRMAIYPETYGDMAGRYEAAIAGENLVRLHDGVAVVGLHNVATNASGTDTDDGNCRRIAQGTAERGLHNINVAAIEIEKEYYKKFRRPTMPEDYVEGKLGPMDQSAFNILIAHNPEYFKAYAAYHPDLVVSGHVHGGIARLPILGGVISPRLRLFPRYDGGRFEEGGTTMILSRGLGSHTLPVRFFNPGELVVIRLVPAGRNHS